MSSSPSSVTVVVCTRDRPDLLEQCLHALSRQTYRRFDVLVVDNAPTHPVQNICLRWGATWVLAPLRGVARARNVGAKLAQGEIVAFIDDDAIAEPEWLEALVRDFEDHAIAAVSGGIRYMKSVGDSRAMSSEEAAPGMMKAPRSFDLNTPGWFTLACFGGISDGGNMAFRREQVPSLVAFDERLGRGRLIDSGEEHVLFASLIARGYRVAHNPAAIWRHPSPPTAELQRAKRLFDLRSSIAYLMFVWHEFPSHRIDIVRFLSRAVLKRVFSTGNGHSTAAHLPSWPALRAVLGGALLFWKSCRESTPPRVRREGNAVGPLPGLIKPVSDARQYIVE